MATNSETWRAWSIAACCVAIVSCSGEERPVLDAGTRADAAGSTSDAGSAHDAAVARDASVTTDTGVATDAGARDAGPRLDAGTTCDRGWCPIPTTGAPIARARPSTAWTGTEMIVWGGEGADLSSLGDGAEYDPATLTWRPIPRIVGGPASLAGGTTLWSGTVMIVWGGHDGFPGVMRFGRLDPTTNVWADVATTGQASERHDHAAVWTGTEMIVWGGQLIPFGGFLDDGGRYDAVANTWAPLPASPSVSARAWPTAVWTGTEMIVWGGDAGGGTYPIDGGRFNPSTGTWTPLSTTGAPRARYRHTAIWTGTEMIIWGGAGPETPAGAPIPQRNGARYSPATNTWTPMSMTGSPSTRFLHQAVWTGTEMIVWGGMGVTDGGRYDPATDTWAPLGSAGEPEARTDFAMVWTGTELLVWGGLQGATTFGDGARWRP